MGKVDFVSKRYHDIDYTQAPDTYWKTNTIHNVKYLFVPRFKKNEVEIARQVLASQGRDVTSFRVQRKKDGAHKYDVVDEYEVGFEFPAPPKDGILNLGQVVDWINHTTVPGVNFPFGIGLCITSYHTEGIPDEKLKTFARFESEYYPKLGEHYRRLASDWYTETLFDFCEKTDKTKIIDSLIKGGKAANQQEAEQMLKDSGIW